MTDSKKGHVVVIGGGPGGYPAAFYAADLGYQVTIVDEELNPGGVCLYRGCIPSKALLHAAKVINEAKEAEEYGVSFGKPKIDIKKLAGWKEQVINKMTGGLGQMTKMRKVNTIQGRATFQDNKSLAVKKVDGSDEVVTFDFAIIATGSRPTVIPQFDIGSPRVMDSTSGLELEELPGKLLILGGGYIGLEMGTVYAALGSAVTVVEMMPGLLPGADRDLVRHLEKRLKGVLDKVLLKTKVVELKDTGKEVQVTFEDAEGKRSEENFDRVLISIGRKPNSENIGLENTSIKVTERGHIATDPQRRTAEPSIFAIGDVAGEPMLAHKATHEGKVAVEAIDGKKTIFDPRAIPAVVFTDPEIAWCGVTESEAKEQKLKVKIAKFPWAASGRATTLGRDDGVTKLIVDEASDAVIGIGIAGPGAGDLIAEGVLAIEMGATVEDLALTIHPHPTLSETIMEAAEAYYGHSPHFYQKR